MNERMHEDRKRKSHMTGKVGRVGGQVVERACVRQSSVAKVRSLHRKDRKAKNVIENSVYPFSIENERGDLSKFFNRKNPSMKLYDKINVKYNFFSLLSFKYYYYN